MAAGFYRPASVAKFEAALDAKGQPTMLKCGVGSPSIMAASGFMKIPDNGVDSFAMEGIADHPTTSPTSASPTAAAEPGPQVWFWRSVGHSQNIFFIESFIDELAAAAKADPFEYRRALLGKQPRYKGVLELAAQKAGWGSPLPKGVFRGIAVAQSFGSYVAEVAEVSIGADGTPRVHRVVAAVDCGMTVNPQTIERQIEGAIVYGLSAALYGPHRLQGRARRAGQLQRLPGAAHERDAQGGSAHRPEQRNRAASASRARRRSRRRWPTRSSRRRASGCAVAVRRGKSP